MPTSSDFERVTRPRVAVLMCRCCGAVEDLDCAAGHAPCPTASQAHGFTIEAAEVVYRGVCPTCLATATS